MRGRLGSAVAIGVTALLGVLPNQGASAGQICASYWARAPVVGYRSDTRCGPSIFSHRLTVWDCESFPPVGVSGCVTVSVDLP